MKKTALLISFLIFGLTIFAQSDKMGSFTDSRDGQIYDYIKIGTQVWMAENLNYNPGSWQYDRYSNNPKTCAGYYNWETAINVCPLGWHLPTKREFKILLRNYGGEGEEAHNALIVDGTSGFNASRCNWFEFNGRYYCNVRILYEFFLKKTF